MTTIQPEHLCAPEISTRARKNRSLRKSLQKVKCQWTAWYRCPCESCQCGWKPFGAFSWINLWVEDSGCHFLGARTSMVWLLGRYFVPEGGQTPMLMNGWGHGEPGQGWGFPFSGHFLQKPSWSLGQTRLDQGHWALKARICCVLVFCFCCNKFPQTCGFKWQIHSITLLEVRSQKLVSLG